ncbi:MAG: TolC family protein [Chitinophagaceae bacterium]|nr:TolC family protein [Chitinophagaceae bacterium]
MLKQFLCTAVLFFLTCRLQAQDSVRVLTEEKFLELVKQYHPVAKQAGLLVDAAKARLLSIRGSFDPVVFLENNQKTFDGKSYYNYSNAELAVPTWFGVELYGGLENNFGDFINPELTQSRSSYAGISVPLLKDLILDKRRAALQQGKLFTQQSVFERSAVMNDLLFDAYKAYWDWAKDYQVVRVLDTTIALNELRYRLVQISFQQGDRAAVDTTEALAQLQNFQQQREEAWLRFRKSSLELSTFLWLENNKPVYLSEAVIPDTLWMNQSFANFKTEQLSNWITQTISNHPKLKQFDFKLQSLEVERRLKFQNLLPQLDVKYNFLQKGYNVANSLNTNFFQNNYRFGVSAVIPIPNRSGIGDYRSARIKIKSTELDRSFTELNLENKVRYHYNEVVNLQKQVSIYENAYRNYQRLFTAEQLKFSLGETTLFLLNSRETKVLEAQQKLLELKTKFYQAFAALNWATGILQ